jgi:hypothetical protein
LGTLDASLRVLLPDLQENLSKNVGYGRLGRRENHPGNAREMYSASRREDETKFDRFSFGSIQIDDTTYEHDVVIDRGEILKRKKEPSKQFQDPFGHTPLSVEEHIPWKCR